MVGEKFTIFSLLKYLFIAFFSLIIIYPLLNVLAVSLSSNNAILTRQVTFYPIGFNPHMYVYIWQYSNLARAYFNTLRYVVLHTGLAMFVTTCAAYALSKGSRMWGYKFFMNMILFTMFFGGGLIPSYLTIRAYGLINTTAIIVILGCCGAYNIIVMRTFFQNLPKDLEDAGKIDGLNDFGVLRHVALPLSAPIMTTISLFYAVGQWNSFFTPFIYLSDTKKWPVQILLRELLIQGTVLSEDSHGASSEMLMLPQSLINATIVVAILPMIVIYPFLQKFFVKGVMIGSIKA